MILKANLVKDKRINNLIKKNISNLENFWDFKLKKEPIITFLDSRKEIDLIRKNRTDGRLVGWFWKDNNIFILDPSKFELESVFLKKDFEKIIIHELSHLFFYQIAKSSCPAWLDEGLACYLAGQKGKKLEFTEDNVSQLIACYYEFDRALFDISYFMAEKLINYKGRKKLIELVMAIKGGENQEKHFRIIFEKIYGLEFNKDNLYKLFK